MKQRLIMLSVVLIGAAGLYLLLNGDKGSDPSEISAPVADNFAAEPLPPSSSSPDGPRPSKVNTRQWRKKANELLQCAQSETCNFPKTDPRSYYFALGNAMREHLQQVTQAYEQGNLNEGELRQIAHDFFSHNNGHVQAEAIAILSRLPVDASTLEQLTEVFSDNYDSVLLEKALPLLETYFNNGFSYELNDLLLNQIATGAHYVRQTLSANLLPFLNSANVDQFRQLSETLSDESLERKNLQATLREYELLRQGG